MFNFGIAAATRTAVAYAIIGLTGVCVTSACTPVTHSAPSLTPSTTTSAASTSAPSPSASPAAAGGVYGNPAAAAKYWQQQSLEDNCGLVSVADVVGELTGRVLTEQQVITLAENTPSQTNPGPIYAPGNDPSHTNGNGGIEMGDIVVLLDHYGIKSAMTDNTHADQTGMTALQHYLADNRKVIAWVNSAIIWNTSDQRTSADHFLVVTGLDTNTQTVDLNDPGADHADEQVSVATFTNAWKTGGDSIVVTAAAA